MGTVSLHVTSHAIERAMERIGCKTPAEAQAMLTGPFIVAAADFGAQYVRLATGQRIVLDGRSVVTVLPANNFKRQVARKGLGRYGKTNRWEREE